MTKLNRRDVIKSLSAIGALVLPVGSFAMNGSSGQEEINTNPLAVDKGQLALRKKARWRTRRMIMNNDGNDINLAADMPVSPELFLNKRTSPLIGSHVDSFFYCDGINNRYSHLSDLTELPVGNPKAMNAINEFKRLNTDSLGIIINFCRQHNKEVFWSMRMNDLHDSSATRSSLLTQWKRDHPEYLMGKPGEKSSFMNKWTALNYGKQEVRDRILLTFKDVVTRYDVDGIELDFFRHPVFFKAQYEGGNATQDDCEKMSQLVRNIRSMCDEEGKKRGRPVLVSVRLPDSVAYSKAIGLDIITWLKEDLIDLMSTGSYFKMEPWANWGRLGREYAVPVYAGLDDRRLSSNMEAEGKIEIEHWRGEALIAWEAGVNGIYTFNRFNPHEKIFWELGDPALLKTLPLVKEESYVNPQARGVVSPDTWLKDGRRFLKK